MRTYVNVATRLPPKGLSCLPEPCQGVVDRVGCLAVILPEQVCIDPERDVRLRVAEPLGDRDDVDSCIDQLAGVRVPQPVEIEAGKPMLAATCAHSFENARGD